MTAILLLHNHTKKKDLVKFSKINVKNQNQTNCLKTVSKETVFLFFAFNQL